VKPSVKKLRLALITIAALVASLDVEILLPGKENTPVYLLSVVGLIVSLMNLYLATSLKRLLEHAPRTISLMTMTTATWLIVGFMVAVMGNSDPLTSTMVVLTVVLGWYAHRSVRQMSAELKSPMAPEPEPESLHLVAAK
jgi:CHASE2 domain-containing sensor protein